MTNGRYRKHLIEMLEKEGDIEELRKLALSLAEPKLSIITSKEVYDEVKDVPGVEREPLEDEIEKIRAQERKNGVNLLEDFVKERGAEIPIIFTSDAEINSGPVFRDYVHVPKGDEISEYVKEIEIRAEAYNKIVDPFPRFKTVVDPQIFKIINGIDDITPLKENRIVKISAPPGTIQAIFEVFLARNKFAWAKRERDR